jgi:hypothetical protein
MRIWSLHPKYLDSKGLVALWRETLLAKHVLLGKTKGYTHHPQLRRFKNISDPVGAVDHYLSIVVMEADSRGYKFDRQKIDWNFAACSMHVTKGQFNYEISHLLKKLKTRDRKKYNELRTLTQMEPHPIFELVEGEIEDWEIP